MTGYLAVLVLFCFGFLGVLAFLSMSLLCRAGWPVADPDATGAGDALPPGFGWRARLRQPAAIPAMAGMTSVPMRSSCSRSSPFIR